MVIHCKLRAAIGYNCDHRRKIDGLIAREYRSTRLNSMSPMADMQQMSAKDNHANIQIG
jgi:hypothetical protein